ncbi:Uncharacterised protein [Cronobacter sakazakii]|nr:Uncharacterised protein [Cronobacter sakazakii]
MNVLAIDIGGTKLAAATVDASLAYQRAAGNTHACQQNAASAQRGA